MLENIFSLDGHLWHVRSQILKSTCITIWFSQSLSNLTIRPYLKKVHIYWSYFPHRKIHPYLVSGLTGESAPASSTSVCSWQRETMAEQGPRQKPSVFSHLWWEALMAEDYVWRYQGVFAFGKYALHWNRISINANRK